MNKLFRRLKANQKGATAVEYGLIISLIVLAMVTALKGVSDSTNNKWSYVSNTVLAN